MTKRRGNKEGSLFKRPNGTWRAQVTVGGKRLSTSTKTRKEGQHWLKKTIEQVDSGLTFENSKLRLEDFLNEWHENVQFSLRPDTWNQYGQIINDHIIPTLGKIKLIDLHPDRIQRLYNERIQDGIGHRTIQLTHSVLRRALNQGVKLGLIIRNPTSATNPPKPIQNEMKVLNEFQAQQLIYLAESVNNRFAVLFHLAIITGMRKSELLGLRWNDLDWTKRTLQVQSQIKRIKGGGFYFSSPKTKSGKRKIILGENTIKKLNRHFKQLTPIKQKAEKKWQEHDLIFPSIVGTPLNQSKISKSLKNLLKEAQLPVIRFHDLRHTAASLMLNYGIPVIIVSRRLGHARPSITLDIYGHLIPSRQEEAAELMDKLISPIPDLIKSKTAPKLHQN